VAFNAARQDNYQVTITNTLGEKVYVYSLQQFSGEHRKELDLRHLSKGVYMMTVTASGSEKSISKRITIQ